MKRKKIDKDFALLYAALTFAGLMALLTVAAMWKGGYWPYFFWHDTKDSCMDYYNSLEECEGDSVYETYTPVYPFTASAMLRATLSFVDDEALAGLPSDHLAVIGRRRTWHDPRTFQSMVITHGIWFIPYLVLTPCLVAYKFRELEGMSFLPGAASAVSYGSLCALERGNIVCISAMLAMIFLFGYDSKRPWVRAVSAACLVMSFGIKLYPCLYGLILIDDKRYKEAAAAAVSGLAIFIASMQPFGGFSILPLYLKTLLSFNGGDGDAVIYRYGIRGVAEHFAKYFFDMPLPHADVVSPVLLTACSLILITAFFYHVRRWHKLFCITLLIVLIQGESTDYTLCFFTPVLLLMIYDEGSLRKKSAAIYLYTAILFILTLPYPTPPLSGDSMMLHRVDWVHLSICLSISYETAVAIRAVMRLLSRIPRCFP